MIGRYKNQVWLNLFGVSIFCLSRHKNGFWIRIFGYGITVKHKSEGLTFSQRNGKQKYYKIWNYIVFYLPKNKIKK